MANLTHKFRWMFGVMDELNHFAKTAELADSEAALNPALHAIKD